MADLDAVRRHFGLERMALLGHSWGAQLALSHALAHPDRRLSRKRNRTEDEARPSTPSPRRCPASTG
ncbi:alpha/beta fold hydrolase [Streptomyces sp. NPDC020192]|uniref:alpha/beta fold hydrolase n=1 Tax=Streptomyces sp. NPDC020192 TaxID=3365066 RepID=UPI0037BCB421